MSERRRSGLRLPASALVALSLTCVSIGQLLGASPAGDQQRPAPSTHRRPPKPISTQPDLRGEDELTRAYDAILDARFDEVDAELSRACPPAPAEACSVLDATSLWWRILLDSESHELDDEFTTAADKAIRATEAWTTRAPDDPEAWFYLGGAYAVRVQWRVLRDNKLSAARDGKRIKQALERSLALDPELDNAYFGIGMYKYYADIAPAAAKVLRFLLLLPGGNRRDGLAEMLRAREQGRLLQGEADYQLHVIYLWYEQQTPRALELLRGLEQRYPGNPLFLAQIAEIQDGYEHDITASLDTWRTLLSRAREQRVNLPALAEARARLGVAAQLEALEQTDHAIEQLTALVARKPEAPYSALALAYLRLGEAQDRLGDREAATEAYRDATTAAPEDDPLDIRSQAAERIRRAPDARKAEAYRLSLEGWRHLERDDLPGATAALERSIAFDAQDPVARYRYGRLLQRSHDDAGALAQFELTIRNGRQCPAPILGTAYLETARLHERAGRTDDAIAGYRIAATLFGAAAETKRAASRALARLAK